jgi:6-phosphofructokinase 1
MAKKWNLVVGQGGGPTAVINCSLLGVVQEAMAQDKVGEIYGMAGGIEGFMHNQLVDMRRQPADVLEGLRQTPGSALGTCRYKPKDDDLARILEVLSERDIRYFFYIGGNDSATIAHRMNEYAKKVGYELFAIAVPKTVDNDLVGTDHCPGYGSGARFVASAIRNTGRDTEAMGKYGPIRLMEIMGRNAGWLTAAAALAKESEQDAPHLVYVPERPVSLEQVIEDTRAVYKELGFAVLAVSEGTLDLDGKPLGEKYAPKELDGFGHARKGGVTQYLAIILSEKIGVPVRLDNPYYLQRCFSETASPVDQQEAYLVGRKAVETALGGKGGYMVTLVREPGKEYHCSTGLISVEQVADKEKFLPKEWMNREGNFPTQEFLDYARPLMGGPLLKHVRLDLTRVK